MSIEVSAGMIRLVLILVAVGMFGTFIVLWLLGYIDKLKNIIMSPSDTNETEDDKEDEDEDSLANL